jgi:hypothetical protein
LGRRPTDHRRRRSWREVRGCDDTHERPERWSSWLASDLVLV